MSAADLAKLKEEIRRAALTSGFDAARFAAADYGARSAADLAAFLAEGRAGTMPSCPVPEKSERCSARRMARTTS